MADSRDDVPLKANMSQRAVGGRKRVGGPVLPGEDGAARSQECECRQSLHCNLEKRDEGLQLFVFLTSWTEL